MQLVAPPSWLSWGQSILNNRDVTLWWTNISNGKSPFLMGQFHYKWPFSLAMLVHQRVCLNWIITWPSNCWVWTAGCWFRKLVVFGQPGFWPCQVCLKHLPKGTSQVCSGHPWQHQSFSPEVGQTSERTNLELGLIWTKYFLWSPVIKKH